MPQELRSGADANLLQRAAWLEPQVQLRSPMLWLCDRMESMVEAACNLKLPMLRSEMNNYVRRFTTYVASDRLNDLAGQIWQNSKIASLKYDYLKRAMLFAVFALLPWTATLLATSLTHWRAPLAG